MSEITMISPTYGKVNLTQIISIIKDYISKDKNGEYNITIGTDSQNFNRTKIVKVIAVHKKGKGGIFFYETIYLPLIKDIRSKLTKETKLSIDLANAFIDELEREFDRSDWDYTEYNIDFSIHCDIGHDGKTNVLIPEITAWVASEGPAGFKPVIKPFSFAASSIANKYSK